MNYFAMKTERTPPLLNVLLSLAVSAGVLATSLDAYALEKEQAQVALKRSVINPLDMDNKVKLSSFVFLGKVIDVQYRNSRKGIPHTFVTFNIEKSLKGNYQDTTVTLRFIGGVKKVGKNRYEQLEVSHVPTFEKGDLDFVFAGKNGQSMCPLVGCSDGRYRMTKQGFVAANNGRQLGISDKEKLVFLPSKPAHTLAAKNLAIKVDDIGEEELTINNNITSTTPLTADHFIDKIRTIAYQLPYSANTLKSVAIDKPFSIPLMKPQQPSRPGNNLSIPIKEEIKTELDKNEEALLKDNRNNPVIK